MSMGVILRGDGVFKDAIEANVMLAEADRKAELDRYITWAEDTLLDLPQADVGLGHWLMDGLYARTMHCPAGVTLTGAIHKKACLTILSEGEISILTINGCALFKAPLVFPSEAGIRRLGYCHTDVVWTTVHSVLSDNLDDIEAELFDFVGGI